MDLLQQEPHLKVAGSTPASGSIPDASQSLRYHILLFSSFARRSSAVPDLEMHVLGDNVLDVAVWLGFRRA